MGNVVTQPTFPQGRASGFRGNKQTEIPQRVDVTEHSPLTANAATDV